MFFRSLIFTSLIIILPVVGYAQSAEVFKFFTTSGLIEKQVATGKPWYEFLNEPTMFAGIYHLGKGAADAQQPHKQDEVYFVVQGKSNFNAGKQHTAVVPGQVLYVKAGVPHNFTDITEDLILVVLFSNGVFDAADPEAAFYSLESLEPMRKSNENVWTPFHKSKPMVVGLYQLPKSLGGDETLTHKFDEINIVMKGNGKFTVDGKETPVKEGDIFFVKKGSGHFFKNPGSDLDVMIMFEMKSIEK